MPADDKADSSTAVDGKEDLEASGTTKPDDEETVENVPWNKDARFKEFIGKRKLLKEYEGLGTPEEISGYVQQLETRLEKLEEDRRPKEPKTTEQKATEEDLAKARKQLREIDPDLAEIGALRDHRAAQNRSLEVRALDETAIVMKSAGLSVSKADVTGMTNILADIIGGDEVLTAEYIGNPREAVRLAWKKLGTIAKAAGVSREDTAAIQREKEKQSKLPKPHGSAGGTGSEKAEGKVKGLADAYARSKAYLRGLD